MKKILILTAVLSTLTFGATPANNNQGINQNQNQKTECPMNNQSENRMHQGRGNKSDKMMKNNMQSRMLQSIPQKDQETLTKNRNELATLRSSTNPDWNRIQKLSDENALIMSRARTEMMKNGGSNNKMENRMSQFISKNDQETLRKNRVELFNLKNSDTPDWNRVQKLSDENALIMSRARTEMMKNGGSMNQGGRGNKGGMGNNSTNPNNAGHQHRNQN